MKLTEWYEAEMKPVHLGAYQVQDLFRDGKYFYAYWNGTHWLIENEQGTKLRFQYRRWRGVSEE